MKTTIEKIEADLKNHDQWIITVICPAPGAIIVINNAFHAPISTYRKGNDGKYTLDKMLPYNDDARGPLAAMIAAHNNSAENQKESEAFDLYK